MTSGRFPTNRRLLIGVAAVAIGAAVILIVNRDSSSNRDHLATSSTTNASEGTSTTSTTGSTTTTSSIATTTTVESTTTSEATTVPDPCLNNPAVTLEACGPPRWAGENAPLQVSATVSADTVHAGETFYITVYVHDDDEQPRSDCVVAQYENPEYARGQLAAQIPCGNAQCGPPPPGPGQWDRPPGPGGGDATVELPVQIYKADSYDLRVYATSGETGLCSVEQPHSSYGSTVVHIEVIP